MTHAHCRLGRLRLKYDGPCAETTFPTSAKRTNPFKSAEASVQSTTCSRGVRISGINAGYTMFRGSVKSTGYTLHSPVSPSLPFPCVTVCHHFPTGLYLRLQTHTNALRISNTYYPSIATIVTRTYRNVTFYSYCLSC
jgi:hypothetical protein